MRHVLLPLVGVAATLAVAVLIVVGAWAMATVDPRILIGTAVIVVLAFASFNRVKA